MAERLISASPDHELTLSAGIAEVRAGETGEQLVARADVALYTAKENGRNRVELELPEGQV